MAKKKRHEEHVDETWLLPYSDLLTLLLALFIVMYSISSIDKQKFEALSAQLSAIFAGGSGLMERRGQSPIPIEDFTSPADEIERDKMIQIKKNIEEEIKDKGYSDKVMVNLNNEGLEISISPFQFRGCRSFGQRLSVASGNLWDAQPLG